MFFGHGKAHVWCCVPAPLSCYGADADLPGSLVSRQYRLTCPRCVSVILNQLPGSPSPPLLRGSQRRDAGNTGGPTQRARSFAAGLRDAITAAANHRSDSQRNDDICHATAQHFHQAITTRCPSRIRQIAGLRYTCCQPLPTPFCLPSSNNILDEFRRCAP